MLSAEILCCIYDGSRRELDDVFYSDVDCTGHGVLLFTDVHECVIRSFDPRTRAINTLVERGGLAHWLLGCSGRVDDSLFEDESDRRIVLCDSDRKMLLSVSGGELQEVILPWDQSMFDAPTPATPLADAENEAEEDDL